MAVPALFGGASAAAQTNSPTVIAGSGEPGYAVNLFGPNEVTVAVGGTVTFKAGWKEPHTVTFPGTQTLPTPDDPNAAVPTNPGELVSYDGTQYVSSGFIASGSGFTPVDSFQISFAKAGSYPFACIIHPGMSGVVKVVAAGAPVSTQASLDAAAKTTFADGLSALKDRAGQLSSQQVSAVHNADGTSTWHVTVGGVVGTSDLQQFFPPSMNVQEGDTVVWESAIQTPHTVTFLAGEDLGAIFAAGPPDPLENEKIFLPTPAEASGYTGSGFISSGVIGQGFPSGQSFSVKFAKAGGFSYICVLHVDQGMGGVINVAAKAQASPTATATAKPAIAGTPAPPKTGNGGVVATVPPYAPLVLAGSGLVLLLGARLATARRR
jgi:plastocyanin